MASQQLWLVALPSPQLASHTPISHRAYQMILLFEEQKETQKKCVGVLSLIFLLDQTPAQSQISNAAQGWEEHQVVVQRDSRARNYCLVERQTRKISRGARLGASCCLVEYVVS